jgi:RNA polymerase sigma-70 factor (ECF subfamily)
MDERVPEPIAGRESASNAEHEMLMADSVGLALMVVLQTLAPAERIAFVLHDMFDLSFDEIGPIVGRSSTAARQLASRARRRVQGERTVSDRDLAGQREVVDAFLAAARGGDLNGILAVLDPEVVFRADPAAVQASASTAPSEVRGAATVAKFFSGRAQAARSALIDGAVGIVVAPRGRLFLVLIVTIENGRIAALEAVADAARLSQMDMGIVTDETT